MAAFWTLILAPLPKSKLDQLLMLYFGGALWADFTRFIHYKLVAFNCIIEITMGFLFVSMGRLPDPSNLRQKLLFRHLLCV
jgi:hypothetical protein